MRSPKKTAEELPPNPTKYQTGYLAKKASLEKAGRSTRYFDLSFRVQELLREAAEDRRVPQVTMLEHIIRSYCEPDKVRKNDVF